MPTDEQPYQYLPPLTASEFEALYLDIERNGVRTPIDVDQHGTILDGHHRAAVCAALGIDVPTRVVEVADAAAARDHALAVNLSRRHLTREQRRHLIAESLLNDPGIADRAHARRCGCSPSTVATVRAELVGTGRLSKLDRRIGADRRPMRTRAAPYRWPDHSAELLAEAMAAEGLTRVLPFLQQIPSPGRDRDAWDGFVQDIAEHGVLFPIVATGGTLIDGRSRLMAARLTGTPAEVLRIEADDAAATRRCISENFQRQGAPWHARRLFEDAQTAWRAVAAGVSLSGDPQADARVEGMADALLMYALELRTSGTDATPAGSLLRQRFAEMAADEDLPPTPLLEWMDLLTSGWGEETEEATR